MMLILLRRYVVPASIALVVGVACNLPTDPTDPTVDGGSDPSSEGGGGDGPSDGDTADGTTGDAPTADAAADGRVADGGDGGPIVGTDGGSDGGSLLQVSCPRPCPAGQKLDGRCVAASDPRFGCGLDAVLSPPLTANAQLTCVGETWKVTACSAGWGDCDPAVVGCETKLGTVTSCGACGDACAVGQVCHEGACKAGPCPFPQVSCDGACRDFATSPVACGACTTACPTGGSGDGVCNAGSCTSSPGHFNLPVCPAGLTGCEGNPAPECVSTSDDPLHCGGCSPCPQAADGAVAVCNAGVCGTQCAQGFVDCGGSCVSLKGDAAHCGACGNVCAAGETCGGGECVTPASTMIATGFTAASYRAGDIALDGAAAYVLDAPLGTITRIDKLTLASTTLVANAYVGASNVAYVRTHGGYVYWNASLTTSIVRAPAAGGAIESIVTAPSGVTFRDFVVDASHVYAAALNGNLYVAPNAPGSVAAANPASLGVSVSSLSDGGPYIYAAISTGSNIRLVRFEKATRAVTVAAQTVAPLAWGPSVGEGYALIGGPASFTVADNILSSRRPETAPYGFVHGFRRQGGGEAIVATGDGCSTWNGIGASLTRMDGANGPRRTVGAAVGTTVARIAVDSTHAYWLDGAGYVGRIKK